MSLTLRNYHFADTGSPRAGASVTYKAGTLAEPNANPVLGTTTTNASGMWEFTGVASGTYDVYLVDGSTEIIWKGQAALPQSFGDGQIASAADIALTKLNQGTADQTVTPATTPTTLDGRISQIAASLKQAVGGTNWYTAPTENLNTHVASKLLHILSAVRARRAAATTAITTSTWTAVQHDTEDHDTDTMHSTVSAQERVVFTTAGKYWIKASATFESNSTGTRGCRIVHSVAGIIALSTQNAASGVETSMTAQTTFPMNAAETCYMEVFQSSGGNLNLLGAVYYSPQIEAFRITS